MSPLDCAELVADAPAAVARCFPSCQEVYSQLGRIMFLAIDCVCVAKRAARRLGFACHTAAGSSTRKKAFQKQRAGAYAP